MPSSADCPVELAVRVGIATGPVKELLAPVYDWLSGGFDKPDLTDARAMLEKLA